MDWQLALLALLPAPLVSVVVIQFGRRIHDRFEAIQKMFSDISSRVQENLSGVRVVRAYVQEQAEIRQFEVLNQDYIAENIRLARLSGLFMPLLQALIGLTFLIVLWVGGYRLLCAPHQHRQLRDVQHLHGHAGLAHDRHGLGGESDAARAGLLGAHHGVAGGKARHREPPPAPGAAAGQRRRPRDGVSKRGRRL